ncbi:hypothetical protein FV242_26505 [Methylobacterium sp. WL64]|uniref:hypothetical protein n=1 Tax=Methylobacterium sp. WL64 TaxID=2603894 RepID=UPI0011CB9905|nr:hypothetical protein [Methylobacterium sp. WL64]TXM99152.1 hypothetical protein FV242_26505 [Methylobacterium sp. WL64]
MADLLQYPTQPRSRHARRAYQVRKFAADGGMKTSRTITARNDADATRQALDLADQHGAELWSASRLVGQFGLLDDPTAISIKMLADRSTIGC